MSFIYEGVLLFGVVFFFGYAFSALTRHQNQSETLRWAFQGFMFVVLGVYFVWFWSAGRRTLPMKTVGLRIVDRAGAPLSAARAFGRYSAAWAVLVTPLWAASEFYAVLGPMLEGAIALCVVLERQHRAPWDLLSGTLLVHVPGPGDPEFERSGTAAVKAG
jgi:uncharacterized RDD family membrane protein YckC